MVETFTKIATLPLLGKVRVNFYGVVCEVIDLYQRCDEFERQKNIKHLGLISKVFDGASHSRYEYVMLQCALADMADVIHKGSSNSVQGSIKVDGHKYYGNSIIKSWSLLSNFGHMKNTIGDEKSLLLFSKENDKFKNEILKDIKDVKLRAWCKSVVDEFRYGEFHYVLSIWRVYKLLTRYPARKGRLVLLFKLLLLDYSDLDCQVNKLKLEQIRSIFRIIRSISIVTIDGYYSHTTATVNVTTAIISIENEASSYREKTFYQYLRPFVSSLYEEIYLDKQVQSIQRCYEVFSLDKLRNDGDDYEDVIDRCTRDGLSEYKSVDMVHFVRFRITENMRSHAQLYDEHINLQSVKDDCQFIETSVDDNPITNIRYADFYISKSEFTPSNLPIFLFRVSQLVSRQIEHLIKNASSEKFVGRFWNR